MSSFIREIATFAGLGLSSIPKRASESAAVVVSTALAVCVLLAALSMERGFRATMDGSGSENVVIAGRAGSNSELDSVIPHEQARLLETAPGIVASPLGGPSFSAEVYATVSGVKRSSGLHVNLPLRGVGPHGPELRDGFRLVAGRMFAEGSNEIIVGQGALREFSGLQLGQIASFGASRWRVVGVFATPGTIFESEIWGDVGAVQSLFGRGPTYQSIRMRLSSPAELDRLRGWINADQRLRIEAVSERAFFATQSRDLSSVILWLGWPLAVAIAVGALAGAVNVVFSSVRTRAAEIATLRAIGFGGAAAFAGALAESIMLAGVGGLIGTFAGFALFNGLSASTLGGNFSQVVFSFSVAPEAMLTGLAMAAAIGLIGGAAPAWRAATDPITHVHQGAP